MSKGAETSRECPVESCPYRYPAPGATGKRSGYCGMVRPMLASMCPARGDAVR
jgi:hypothetical protein